MPSGPCTLRSEEVAVKADHLVLVGESEGSGHGLWKSDELRNRKFLCAENTRCEICGQLLK